jgi:hypothetical protein
MTKQQRQQPAAPSVRNKHAAAATAIRGPGLLLTSRRDGAPQARARPHGAPTPSTGTTGFRCE